MRDSVVPAGAPLKCQVCDSPIYVMANERRSGDIVRACDVYAVDGHETKQGEHAYCTTCGAPCSVYAEIA